MEYCNVCGSIIADEPDGMCGYCRTYIKIRKDLEARRLEIHKQYKEYYEGTVASEF